MEIIDSHTHWGPSVTMGIEVTTTELLRQAEQSGVGKIVIFPFPSQALNDPRLRGFIEESEAINLPIIFEEELAFTDTFVGMTKTMKIIIPHLGLLGGNPLDF